MKAAHCFFFAGARKLGTASKMIPKASKVQREKLRFHWETRRDWTSHPHPGCSSCPSVIDVDKCHG